MNMKPVRLLSLVPALTLVWVGCLSPEQCADGRDETLCSSIVGAPAVCQQGTCVAATTTGSSSSGAITSSSSSTGSSGSSDFDPNFGCKETCCWEVAGKSSVGDDYVEVAGENGGAVLLPPKRSGIWSLKLAELRTNLYFVRAPNSSEELQEDPVAEGLCSPESNGRFRCMVGSTTVGTNAPADWITFLFDFDQRTVRMALNGANDVESPLGAYGLYLVLSNNHGETDLGSARLDTHLFVFGAQPWCGARSGSSSSGGGSTSSSGNLGSSSSGYVDGGS